MMKVEGGSSTSPLGVWDDAHPLDLIQAALSDEADNCERRCGRLEYRAISENAEGLLLAHLVERRSKRADVFGSCRDYLAPHSPDPVGG